MQNELIVVVRSGGSKLQVVPIKGIIPEIEHHEAPVVVQEQGNGLYGSVNITSYRQWGGKLWEPADAIGVYGDNPLILLPSGRLVEAIRRDRKDVVRFEDLPSDAVAHVLDAVSRLLLIDGSAYVASMGPLLRTYESLDGLRGTLQYAKGSPVNWVSCHPYHAFFASEDYDALCRAGRPEEVPWIRVLDPGHSKVDDETYRACVVEAAAWMALAEFSRERLENVPRGAVEAMIPIKRAIAENWGNHVFDTYEMRNSWPHQGRVDGFTPPERIIEPLRDLTQHMSQTRSFPSLIRSVIARYDRSRTTATINPLDAAALDGWNEDLRL